MMTYEISEKGRRWLKRFLEVTYTLSERGRLLLIRYLEGEDGDFKMSCEDGDLWDFWKGKIVTYEISGRERLLLMRYLERKDGDFKISGRGRWWHQDILWRWWLMRYLEREDGDFRISGRWRWWLQDILWRWWLTRYLEGEDGGDWCGGDTLGQSRFVCFVKKIPDIHTSIIFGNVEHWGSRWRPMTCCHLDGVSTGL